MKTPKFQPGDTIQVLEFCKTKILHDSVVVDDLTYHHHYQRRTSSYTGEEIPLIEGWYCAYFEGGVMRVSHEDWCRKREQLSDYSFDETVQWLKGSVPA